MGHGHLPATCSVCGLRCSGAFGYLGHLEFAVFEDSLPFPFVLTIVGVGTIYLSVKLKRNFNRIK